MACRADKMRQHRIRQEAPDALRLSGLRFMACRADKMRQHRIRQEELDAADDL
ncbi:hypothetical protein [Escherichia albertii]|uniref:hypothetical protein n=1 Tax=Escherichia albertii TaxID=208962 RepID=UPI001485206F|nr:hypothetical protein [Escherichia albertii]